MIHHIFGNIMVRSFLSLHNISDIMNQSFLSYHFSHIIISQSVLCYFCSHIIEHLQNVIKTKPKDQMSEEELEFHYFKMHDYDNNNKLDGVEIGKALTHFHDGKKNNLLLGLWCLTNTVGWIPLW